MSNKKYTMRWNLGKFDIVNKETGKVEAQYWEMCKTYSDKYQEIYTPILHKCFKVDGNVYKFPIIPREYGQAITNYKETLFDFEDKYLDESVCEKHDPDMRVVYDECDDRYLVFLIYGNEENTFQNGCFCSISNYHVEEILDEYDGYKEFGIMGTLKHLIDEKLLYRDYIDYMKLITEIEKSYHEEIESVF